MFSLDGPGVPVRQGFSADWTRMPPLLNHFRHDFQAGITVALVAVPQCMGFASIAGLPPAMGLYTAVIMALAGAAISNSSKLIFGPAVTTSSMILAVMAAVAPGKTELWPGIAGLLAVLIGGFTMLAALLRAGQFARFVSRSVLVGLTSGAGILIIGTQIAPFLGLPSSHASTLLGTLRETFGHIGEVNAQAAVMATATLLPLLIGGRLFPRVPMAFIVLAGGGVAYWLLQRAGMAVNLGAVENIPSAVPNTVAKLYDGPMGTDLYAGAAAIALVGIIQTLAISKALAAPSGEKVDAKRDLLALGLGNMAAGFLHGFPGAGSFTRSALNDMAGARTRLSTLLSGIALAIFVLLAAPLLHWITKPAIAGLLVATGWSIIEWREILFIIRRERADRFVLATTVIGVFVMPIHWAVIVGLCVSVALFLRRVSRLYLVEMVAGKGSAFHEQPIDRETGRHPIAMLQIEGPLFFAHAEELAETLAKVFSRKPVVTIIRMRRTQQIDFSVVTEVNRVVQNYLSSGGHLIICGLTERMHEQIMESPLGRTVEPKYLLKTTKRVFGSAHAAIELAEEIAKARVGAHMPLLRRSTDARGENEETVEGDWSYQI